MLYYAPQKLGLFIVMDFLFYIGDLFTGALGHEYAHVSWYAAFSDHALTITLCAVAIKEWLSKAPNKSSQVSTTILAISYIASSVNFYFFNFLMEQSYSDFSLYLLYTFLDSLTVLCIIFAHAMFRMRFSFSANATCYMVLTSTYLQFFVSFLVFAIGSELITVSDATYYALAGFYSLALNTVCWTAAIVLIAPIKTQVGIGYIKNRALCLVGELKKRGLEA